jgi:hypothetical protein
MKTVKCVDLLFWFTVITDFVIIEMLSRNRNVDYLHLVVQYAIL